MRTQKHGGSVDLALNLFCNYCKCLIDNDVSLSWIRSLGIVHCCSAHTSASPVMIVYQGAGCVSRDVECVPRVVECVPRVGTLVSHVGPQPGGCVSRDRIVPVG